MTPEFFNKNRIQGHRCFLPTIILATCKQIIKNMENDIFLNLCMRIVSDFFALKLKLQPRLSINIIVMKYKIHKIQSGRQSSITSSTFTYLIQFLIRTSRLFNLPLENQTWTRKKLVVNKYITLYVITESLHLQRLIVKLEDAILVRVLAPAETNKKKNGKTSHCDSSEMLPGKKGIDFSFAN